MIPSSLSYTSAFVALVLAASAKASAEVPWLMDYSPIKFA